jgi:bacteriophage CI repressor helix-turn-helix domain
MAVINRLKSVLAEKQLTGKWLAERIGKSENTISKWCSNKAQPSLENLVEIAKNLDIDVKELLISIKN